MRSLQLALAIAFTSLCASAQVTRLVPEQYPTIQGAIDACGTGDTVSVAPGVYAGWFAFNGKDLRLRSRAGPNLTTLQTPTGAGNVVRFSAGSSNAAALVGFTVRGGSGVTQGAGIEIIGSSPVIAQCIIRDNYAGWGGGLAIGGGAPVVVDCLFVANRGADASAIGSGWNVTGGSIVNCTIVGNYSNTMFAYAVVINNSTMTVSNCIVRDNKVYGSNQGLPPFSGFASMLKYSNIDLTFWPGSPWPTNIDVDPSFADPLQGNYRLTSASFSIGAGDAALLPSDTADLDDDGDTSEPIPLDIDGRLRLCAGTLDQGAFEFPISAVAYCTAKLNSLGCLPAINAAGLASAAANSGFLVSGTNMRNHKSGLLLYSFAGRANQPFGGGILCLSLPLKRSPGLSSGGTPLPVNDCSGVYQIDMNAFSHGLLGGTPSASLLTVGARVVTQFWGRDPGFQAPDNITLSDALEYDVQP